MDASGLWTLDQLAEQVEAALSVDYPGAPSGRVRSVPDRRVIRWYTTVGLVDRPASSRGRTALYGERHLAQLVAIKRLQAAGLSLAEIQTKLAGASEGTLRSLARLPEAAGGPLPAPAAPRAARFWSAPPAPVTGPAVPVPTPAADPPAAAATATAATSELAAPAAPAASRSAATWPAGPATGQRAAAWVVAQPMAPAGGDQEPGAAGAAEPAVAAEVAPAIALPGGVTVLLPPGTPYPGAADLTAIRAAAIPLLAELGRRGVIATDSTEGRP